MNVEPHRLQTLAMMVCEGWSSEDIAKAMTLPVEVIKKYVSPQGPETFQKILRAYRANAERQSVERRFRLSELSEQAYDNIKAAMICNDVKFKTETSWRILDEVSPRAVDDSSPGVNLQVNLTRNHQVNAQIVDLGKNLLGEFKALKESDGVSYSKHLKTGSSALPSSFQAVMDETAERGEAILVEHEEVVDVPEGFPRPEPDPEE